MPIHDRPQCDHAQVMFVFGYGNLQQFVTHYVNLTGNVEYLKVMVQNCPEGYNLSNNLGHVRESVNSSALKFLR